ncbi:MAG: 3-oxoacyl-ACP reductase FabG [Candidatus Obscuribacterales bacterium]|nr:3-oxoacyl-ACP reductase FabG [Candidatus Obscuribacterales bacterium]
MLDGKVAFVTGSTRGIGWAVARLLASKGAAVVLNGTKSDLLEKRLEELRQVSSSQHSAIEGDVSDAEKVKSAYQQIFKTYKRLDVLVNNAGLVESSMLGMISAASAEKLFKVNVLGALMNLQEASRLMGRNKSGSIINITSVVASRGAEGMCAYAASKSAMIGMTMSAARELASRNIRVNAVAPGFIETDATAELSDDQKEKYRQGTMLGRLGAADDVAGAVLFLACDYSQFITAQILGVDGGWLN